MKDALRINLLNPRVCFDGVDDVDHLDPARVSDARKEILIQHERENGNELRRSSAAVICVTAGGREDADVFSIGIVVRVVRHPVELPGLVSWRTGLAEKAEASGAGSIQLVHVEAVRSVESIVEVEWRRVESSKGLYSSHAGGRGGLCS